jgi:heme/copper-type cytochrome/quinol oxidase subunit 2
MTIMHFQNYSLLQEHNKTLHRNHEWNLCLVTVIAIVVALILLVVVIMIVIFLRNGPAKN